MFIGWSLAVFVLTIGSSSSNILNHGPCNFLDTVNITEGYKDGSGKFHYRGIVFEFGTYGEYSYVIKNLTEKVLVEPHMRGCICQYKPCIRICCRGNEKMCVKTDTLMKISLPDGDEKNIDLNTNEYGVLEGKPCVEMYKLEPADYDDDKWVLLKNGSLALENNENTMPGTDDYCLGQNESEAGDLITEAMLCYHPSIDPRLTLYPIGMLLSIPFLIATFCVYAFIPELRNLHGKCLMCYVFSLTILYLSLSAVQLDPQYMRVESYLCIFIGYAIYLSVLLCFFWLNVMCYDIWSTFKGGVSRGRGTQSKFLFYCLYAFGCSLVIAVTVYIIDTFKIFSEDFLPNIGFKRCWMQEKRMVEAIYVYTPITIIMVVNIVLYSITAYRIWKVQKETSVIRNGDSQKHSKIEADTDRFFLYLRLFIIMGATWCMESISWVFENSIVFYVSDILNCLQGVIIFFLFVCKPKIKKLIVRRYRSIRKLPPITSQNTSSTNRTETSRISNDPASGGTHVHLTQSEKPMLK